MTVEAPARPHSHAAPPHDRPILILAVVLVAAPAINEIAGILAHGLLKIRKLGVAAAGLRVTGAVDLTRSLSRMGFRKRDPEAVFIRDAAASPPGDWILTSADEDV